MGGYIKLQVYPDLLVKLQRSLLLDDIKGIYAELRFYLNNNGSYNRPKKIVIIDRKLLNLLNKDFRILSDLIYLQAFNRGFLVLETFGITHVLHIDILKAASLSESLVNAIGIDKNQFHRQV